MKNKVLLSVLIAALPAAAQVSMVSFDKYETYKGRKDLEITGTGAGQLGFSGLDTAAGASTAAVQGQEQQEKLQATWFDLAFKYRPTDVVSANVKMRFHQDWQSYFMARSRPIGFMWASADGQQRIGDLGYAFSVGDFKERYSPLTLWTPETEILGESKYFARERAEAASDYFLGDNKRVLQGLKGNLGYRLMGGQAILTADGFFSRIKRAEALDLGGKVSSETRWSNGGDYTDYDAYAFGTNLEFQWNKTVYAGLSMVRAWEDASSFDYESRALPANNPVIAAYMDRIRTDSVLRAGKLGEVQKAQADLATRLAVTTDTSATKRSSDSLNFVRTAVAAQGEADRYALHLDYYDKTIRDLLRTNVNNALTLDVLGYRAGFDLAGLKPNSPLIAEVFFEGAQSTPSGVMLDSALIAAQRVSLKGTVMDLTINRDSLVIGKAMNIGAIIGYKMDDSSYVKAKISYLNNDQYFQNPMAQSPDFLLERINNIDGILNNKLMLSPLDGMYYSVYNYSPNPRVYYDTTNGAFQGNATQLGVEPYQNAPYAKNSFTNSIRMRQNAERMAASGIQEVLGSGLATADRSGLGADIKLAWAGDKITGRVVYGAYTGVANTNQTFNKLGVGAHVAVGALAGLSQKINVDFGMQSDEGTYNKSSLMQFGGDYGFYDRFSLIGGYQTFENTAKAGNIWFGNTADLLINHSQWMAGLEYEFAKNYYVMAATGRSKVEAQTTTLAQNITNIKVRASF